MSKTILIFGAGEGISFEVARKFLSQNFKVILISRTLEKLKKLQTQLSTENVSIYAADISDERQLAQVITEILDENKTIDVVHYNAANLVGSTVLDISAEQLINDFKVNVSGLVTVVQKFQDRLKESKGALLVTGGGLGMSPHPDYVSLSLGKAALKNLTSNIKETLSKDDIYVGTVIINGYVHSGSNLHSPENIAATFWNLQLDRTVNEVIL